MLQTLEYRLPTSAPPPPPPPPKVYLAVFAGRERYMRLLVRYLDRLLAAGSLTAVHVWDFARDPADSRYLHALCRDKGAQYQLFSPGLTDYRAVAGASPWAAAYAHYARADGGGKAHVEDDDDSVFIKCDDDVVYLDGPARFDRFVAQVRASTRHMRKLSIDRVGGPLFLPMIVNNDACAQVLSHMDDGAKHLAAASKEAVERAQFARSGEPLSDWYLRADRATEAHAHFLRWRTKTYRTLGDANGKETLVPWQSRASINFIACTMTTAQTLFARFGAATGGTYREDERFLTADRARHGHDWPNYIVPCLVAVHFAFGCQLAAAPQLDELFLPAYDMLSLAPDYVVIGGDEDEDEEKKDAPPLSWASVPLLCINLDRRPDRLERVTAELARLGRRWSTPGQEDQRQQQQQPPPTLRVQAVDLPGRGALGCTLSHARCLELAIAREWPAVVVLEDDFFSMNSAGFVRDADAFLLSAAQVGRGAALWDVLMLSTDPSQSTPAPPPAAGRTVGFLARVHKAFGAEAYLVRGAANMRALLANLRECAGLLARAPLGEQWPSPELDTHWERLMERDRWFVRYPLTGGQTPGVSDITNSNKTHPHERRAQRHAYACAAPRLLIFMPHITHRAERKLTHAALWERDGGGFSGTETAFVEVARRLLLSNKLSAADDGDVGDDYCAPGAGAVTVVGYSGEAPAYDDPDVPGLRFEPWSAFLAASRAGTGFGAGGINDYDWFCPLFYASEPQTEQLLDCIRDPQRTRVAIWLHCFLDDDGALRRWNEQRGLEVHALAVSQWTLDRFAARAATHGVPFARRWLAPNGVAPRFWRALPSMEEPKHIAARAGVWCFPAMYSRGGRVAARVFENVHARAGGAARRFLAMSYDINDHSVTVQSFVEKLGSLPKARLAAALAGCEYFVYPLVHPHGAVHHDTFGCCVLEALAAGVIVVTWAVGCLPSLFGDHIVALPPPPHYPADAQWARDDWFLSEEAMARLADAVVALDADPVRRADLRRRSMIWARKQTWAPAAEAFRQMLATPPSAHGSAAAGQQQQQRRRCCGAAARV